MAFDGATKTSTQEHKGTEDKNPPDWKRLNPSEISSKTALAGVAACTDGKVANGDLREFIKQDRQTMIMQNDNLTFRVRRQRMLRKPQRLPSSKVATS